LTVAEFGNLRSCRVIWPQDSLTARFVEPEPRDEPVTKATFLVMSGRPSPYYADDTTSVLIPYCPRNPATGCFEFSHERAPSQTVVECTAQVR
jgi:hypothetical protein